MNISILAKVTYVLAMRVARSLAQWSGVTNALKKRLPNREAHWWLSLFAIHDIDAMIELDVPWWSYTAIESVSTFLAKLPNAHVFEYGSGASTIWLAKRAQHVTSIEHDADWFEIILDRSKTFPNIDLKLIKPDDKYNNNYGSQKATGQSFLKYVTEIENVGGLFDLIVIDGRSRVSCLQHALRHITPGGMIVFDNSDRKEYKDHISAANGQIHTYRGRAPALPYLNQTTVIYANSGDIQ